jgi:outer membrane immunogenic protein
VSALHYPNFGRGAYCPQLNGLFCLKRRHMMKHLIGLGFGVLALATAGAASAADLPVRGAPPPRAPVFTPAGSNWTGFYIGANGGGAWSHKCWAFAGVSEGCHNATGGAAGGQIGFNWQTGPLVLGVEFAGDWTSLKGENASLVFTAPQNTNRTKVDGILAATGRLGYAFDAALLYVKGGGAWVSDKYDSRNTATGISTATASETRTGWTVGGGFEYGFTPNWSFAVEYDHYDFGTKGVSFVGPGAGIERIGQRVDLVTGRINYRFGGGGPLVARY